MLKFDNIDTYGIIHAIRGMRNSWNSWDKSDTDLKIGNNDLKLCKKLIQGGSEHRKFLRMIIVYMDITAPLYWWKQFDTYKVGTVVNSCSTMHTIMDKEFTEDDFSFIKLSSDVMYSETISAINGLAKVLIPTLNIIRREYLKTKDKIVWEHMIEMLPSAYNQKRTVMLNYEVAYNIYKQRKNHKLKEWQDFCNELVRLPYFKELFLEDEND